MTFALKDFETLKKEYDRILTTYIRHERKESIDELPVKRKEQFLFLSSILTELEARIKNSNPNNLKPFAEIFYGAMFVIKQDVKDTLGWGEQAKDSLLFKGLNKIMSINEKNTPTIHQYASCYKALNNFLPLIYKNHDSRLGLKFPNALDRVPTDKLAALITTSYTLEELSVNELTKAFVTAGKETHISYYRVTKDTPASALQGFSTWDDLKTALDSLIIDECADKNVADIKTIKNPVRVAQIQSLQAIAETLTDPKPTGKKFKGSDLTIKMSERIAILAGMMLLVREQIGHEYGKAPLDISENNSVTHTGLSQILKIKDLGHEDAQALITAARNFITTMTIERIEVKDSVKEAVRSKHIFSNIEDFNLVSVLDWTEKLIKTYRLNAFETCLNSYKTELEALKPKEPSYSYTSYLTVKGWLGKKPVEEEEDDLNTEDNLKEHGVEIS